MQTENKTRNAKRSGHAYTQTTKKKIEKLRRRASIHGYIYRLKAEKVKEKGLTIRVHDSEDLCFF